MLTALVPLIFAVLVLVSGIRSVLKDVEERRWGWAGMGCLSTVASLLALVLIANLMVAAAAGL